MIYSADLFADPFNDFMEGSRFVILLARVLRGAWGETRTLTWLPIPEFESGASTNFATQARYQARAVNLTHPAVRVPEHLPVFATFPEVES